MNLNDAYYNITNFLHSATNEASYWFWSLEVKELIFLLLAAIGIFTLYTITTTREY